MNAEITRQATMVGYIDAFWFLFIVTVATIPLILLLRKPAKAPAGSDASLHMD